MQISELTDQLEVLARSPSDFAAGSYDLTEAWLAAGVGIEAVEAVLRFMESHSSIDFGSPGPLVHFVERFNGERYLDALRASLERKPTFHTAWMLNRVANVARTHEARMLLIDLMERARSNPAASEEAVAALTRSLERQRKLLP